VTIADCVAVSVLTRTPVPGETKRRLIPALGGERAAALHQVMLERTVCTAVASQIGPVELVCTPTTQHPFLETLAKRYRVPLRCQTGGGLGEKMRHELTYTLQSCRFAAVVGSDCPGIQLGDYAQTRQFLADGADAVLGPSRDGGYYLLGLRRVDGRVFDDIPWGEDCVASVTRERFVERNLCWNELPVRVDVDRVEDIAEYPELHKVP
jgi:hypothetical protein